VEKPTRTELSSLTGRGATSNDVCRCSACERKSHCGGGWGGGLLVWGLGGVFAFIRAARGRGRPYCDLDPLAWVGLQILHK